jgi:hypothetical protein
VGNIRLRCVGIVQRSGRSRKRWAGEGRAKVFYTPLPLRPRMKHWPSSFLEAWILLYTPIDLTLRTNCVANSDNRMPNYVSTKAAITSICDEMPGMTDCSTCGGSTVRTSGVGGVFVCCKRGGVRCAPSDFVILKWGVNDCGLRKGFCWLP